MSTDTLLETPADSESKAEESNNGFATPPPETSTSEEAIISDEPKAVGTPS